MNFAFPAQPGPQFRPSNWTPACAGQRFLCVNFLLLHLSYKRRSCHDIALASAGNWRVRFCR